MIKRFQAPRGPQCLVHSAGWSPRTIAIAASLLMAACQTNGDVNSPEAPAVAVPTTQDMEITDTTIAPPTTQVIASPNTTAGVPPIEPPAVPDTANNSLTEITTEVLPPTTQTPANPNITAPINQPRPAYDFEPATDAEKYERYAQDRLIELNEARFLERIVTSSGMRFDFFQTGLGSQRPVTINQEIIELYTRHAIDNLSQTDQTYINTSKIGDLQTRAAQGGLTNVTVAVILSTDASQCLKDTLPEDGHPFYTFMPGNSGTDGDCMGLGGQTYTRYAPREFIQPVILSGTRTRLKSKSGAYEVRGEQGVTALAYYHELVHALVTVLSDEEEGRTAAGWSIQQLGAIEHAEIINILEDRAIQAFAAPGGGRLTRMHYLPFTFAA